MVIAELQLSNLDTDLRKSKQAAFATSTQKNLKTQWRTYLSFCIYFSLTYLPATTKTISLYTQFLSRSFKSVNSILNYVNGVRLLHLYSGFEFEHLHIFEYNLLIRGLKRLNPHIPHRVMPITPEILLDIVRFLDLSKDFDLAIWCSFLTCFYLMARKSSIIPSSNKEFDIKKHITRKDIVLTDGYLIVTLKYSKTIQCGDRILSVPIVAIPNSPLCLLHSYVRLCEMVKATDLSPAFCYKLNKQICTITHSLFTSTLRKLLKQARYNDKMYSGHSFRRGGATWAFKSNVPGEFIQIIGDWSSDCYKIYLDTTFETKLEIANRIKTSIEKIRKN